MRRSLTTLLPRRPARRPRAPYDAPRYFESKYQALLPREFSDRVMISPDLDPLFARHHYNSVESGIIEYFAEAGVPERPSVLDVGSGAGHWIDFFLGLFDAPAVVGVEFSGRCADELRRKYAREPRVQIVEDDVSRPGFHLDAKFSVVVAIGVMFHVVVDEAWRLAIQNISRHVEPGGTIIVGGDFGLRTRDVSFAPTDDFRSWEEFLNAPYRVALVKKRVRSLRTWRKTARGLGLEVLRVHRTRHAPSIPAPENNLLFLGTR